MTKDQLELVMAREGLTRPQRDAVLAAAEAYAIAQCKAALDALSFVLAVPSGMHWQVRKPCPGPACDPGSGKPSTRDRGRVTCGACKQTPAWREAAA